MTLFQVNTLKCTGCSLKCNTICYPYGTHKNGLVVFLFNKSNPRLVYDIDTEKLREVMKQHASHNTLVEHIYKEMGLVMEYCSAKEKSMEMVNYSEEIHREMNIMEALNDS